MKKYSRTQTEIFEEINSIEKINKILIIIEKTKNDFSKNLFNSKNSEFHEKYAINLKNFFEIHSLCLN